MWVTRMGDSMKNRKKKGFDLDGTLIAYGTPPGGKVVINEKLIDQLLMRGDSIAIISNQGGVPFALNGATNMPMPEDIAVRLRALTDYLAGKGVHISGIYVCAFHERARADRVVEASRKIVSACADLGITNIVSYMSVHARKPDPFMITTSGVEVYFGDSSEDEQAAAAAGIEFVRVERFTGKE